MTLFFYLLTYHYYIRLAILARYLPTHIIISFGSTIATYIFALLKEQKNIFGINLQ